MTRQRQRRRRGNTRDRILNAAADAFGENGFHGTTVRMLCARAKANVAAVSYYFGSKEQLYIETYRYVFENSSLQEFRETPLRVENSADWERELYAWAYTVLRILTGSERRNRWQCRLFSRERTDPSKVLPIIMEEYFQPLLDRLDYLLRMGLPPDTDEDELRIWRIATSAQCTIYAHRKPPWDQILFSSTMPYADWVEQAARQVVESVTSRLTFRPPGDPA